jgi:Cu/Ag efflux protein CusF
MTPARTQVFLLTATLAVGFSIACGQSQSAAPPASEAPAAAPAAPAEPARTAHDFRGTVRAVDPAAKTLTVENENVEGWMMPMTMSYSADKDDVYSTVKVGDQITATVYDGDFKTLYGVKVVASGSDQPASAR